MSTSAVLSDAPVCTSTLLRGKRERHYRQDKLKGSSRLSLLFDISFYASNHHLHTYGKVTASVAGDPGFGGTFYADFDRQVTDINCIDHDGQCAGLDYDGPDGTPVGEPQGDGPLAVTLKRWDLVSDGSQMTANVKVLIEVEQRARKIIKKKVSEEDKTEGGVSAQLGSKGIGKLEDHVGKEKKVGREIDEEEELPAIHYAKGFEGTWTWQCGKRKIEIESLPLKSGPATTPPPVYPVETLPSRMSKRTTENLGPGRAVNTTKRRRPPQKPNKKSAVG